MTYTSSTQVDRSGNSLHARLTHGAVIGSRVLASLVVVVWLTGCKGGSSEPDPDITVIDPLPVARNLLPDMEIAESGFEGEHYSGSAACAACHTDTATGDDRVMVVQTDVGMKDVSIGTAWETSMMANATRDPYWHAVVASELHRFPNLTDEINDTCIRCHAPMASDLAKKTGQTLQLFDTGTAAEGNEVKGIYSLSADNELFNHAMDGVSCTFCHQIDPGNMGDESSMSGGFVVIEHANEMDRPAYGQYEDPAGGYMLQLSRFDAQYSSHMSESSVCATCHNLTTSPVDAEGQPLTDITHFPEQMVFSEWQQSDFVAGGSQAATCQDCHMPKLDKPVALGTTGSDQRNNFAEHTFLAANTVIQRMLQDFNEELGIDPNIDFEPSIERNREFLKTAASLELQNSLLAGEQLSFDVNITNHTGHKLPSGYHSRRVYLHVLVTRASGEVVYENGRIKADGSIPGVSEDSNPDSYESHYDEITNASQVQVYQVVPGKPNGERTHSLLDSTGYLKDNRLTPAGFNKNNVPAEVAVAGQAMTDSDFNSGSDTVTYKVAVDGTGPFNVLVELRYQPIAYGHLADLFKESDKIDQVDMFRTMYDSISLRDEIIATTTATVQ